MLIDYEENEKIRVQVAQKMGWSRLEYNRMGFLVGCPPLKRVIRPVPSYAIDIEAAWQIIEGLVTNGIWIKIENRSLSGFIRNYFVEIGDDKTGMGKANNLKASTAICLAFYDLCKNKGLGIFEPEP